MRKFLVKGKPGKRFNERMELLFAYMEHVGLIMGGGWNTKSGTAEFIVTGHREGCCDRAPSVPRVTEAIRSKVSTEASRLNLTPSWR